MHFYMQKRIRYYFSRFYNRGTASTVVATRFVRRRPLTSFFITLVLLLLVIIVGNILANRNQKTPATVEVTKNIDVYTIGSAPKITLPAKIEKTGIVKVVAQTSGVVQNIYVTEGSPVDKSTVLLDISTNYKGDDIPRLQTGMAATQYKNAVDTYNIQKDLIAKQRELAQKNADNTEQLRQISSQSISETQSLLDLNRDIISRLDRVINATPTPTPAGPTSTPGANPDTVILGALQGKAQALAAVNQLQNALRLTQYQTDTSKPASQLNDLQKDIALKQLDLQEKAAALSKEIARLQLAIASVTESLNHPVSPIAGQIQRVHVVYGQAVTPGTLLFTVAVVGDPEVTAVVSVPRTIAKNVSRMESSVLHIDGTTYTTIPRYVSYEAIDNGLYVILYSIPQDLQPRVTHLGYITVDVPVGLPDTGSTVPFVPIDAVYQTQDEAYLYIVAKGKAQSRRVVLGTVYGSSVEIESGLLDGDVVILNRNIVAGDKVTVAAK
jgi:multidrug efflux pump subunit AcrA (membrane-fusion protein)